jgi:hypothetical protein
VYLGGFRSNDSEELGRVKIGRFRELVSFWEPCCVDGADFGPIRGLLGSFKRLALVCQGILPGVKAGVKVGQKECLFD